MKTWKSLGERRGRVKPTRAEFEEELPVGESVRQISRRDFFRFSGLGFAASLALGCNSKLAEKAVPYLNAKEGLTPGVSRWYATVCGGCAAGCGVLAKSRDGRPIKLEGNPDHPISRGGLCAIGQAQTRGLYDEDRLRGPRIAGREADWPGLDAELAARFETLRRDRGAVRVLAGTVTSPALLAAVHAFLATFPDGRLVQADTLSLSALSEAYARTHGRRMIPHYRLEEADLVVAIEADFLGTWLDPVGFTWAYAQRRGPDKPRGMSRHIQIESGLSLTGGNADERIRLAPSQAAAFLEALAHRLGLPVGGGDLPSELAERADRVATELAAHRGRALILFGPNDPRAQEVCARLNHHLGHEAVTVDLVHPSLQRQGNDGDLQALTEEMAAGKVGALLLLGTNPLYDQPAAFAAAFDRVPLRISLGSTADETAQWCTHLAPDHHWLEAWRDAETVAGCYALAQPLIQPLFNTRNALESFAAWTGRPAPAFHMLQEHWRTAILPRLAEAPGAEDPWDATLRKGVVQVSPTGPAQTYREAPVGGPSIPPCKDGYELLLYAKVGLGDGRHAHIPFLQELPDPITKVTWDNYAQLSPATAARLGFEQGDRIRLRPEGHPVELELPVVVQPGLDDRTIGVAVGYGRTAGGKAGLGIGQNAYPWRSFAGGHLAAGAGPLQIRRGSGRVDLACTQDHHSMEGRELVREMALAPYLRDPASARPVDQPGPSVYSPVPKGPHRWAMVIDLNACTGCSGCVVGCQVENNIPVVGRDEVRRKREMHWIRIDRYYTGSEAEPGVVHQPMMCQQCDHAPCENVCPVLATVHSDEGLNQQVYNRCVGTRYCENNCPYKVRRFNWWEYPHASELENLMLNPDVTVRSRGVMEKCSFCVQRIMAAKITARNEGRELHDGEAVPACMQSCPAQAIVFGDLQDPDSRVAQALRDPKRYVVLGELGIGPSVSYLTRIRNVDATEMGGGHGA